MTDQDSIELALSNWFAWAPGLEDRSSWRAWAEGAAAIEGSAVPAARFVGPLLRRRLSRVGRMAFFVASECLKEATSSPLCIFCSRHGEFDRAYELLCNLAGGETLSPNSFSLSVHNTSSSQFSIWRNDNSPSTALTAGKATLEAGFLEAWCALSEGAAESALVVYHDEVLPSPYRSQKTSYDDSVALALLVHLPEESQHARTSLKLAWRANPADSVQQSCSRNPALDVLKLLLIGGAPIVLDAGRLAWTWSRHDPAH